MLPPFAVVVAQLVEQSLPTPEICGSYRDIGSFIYFQLYKKCVEKTKIKKKEAGNGSLLSNVPKTLGQLCHNYLIPI